MTSQPIRLPIQATADASGNISWTLPPPPQGMVQTVNASVIDGLPGESFTVYIGSGIVAGVTPGLPLITTVGTNAVMDLQAFPSETIVVQGKVAASATRTIVFTGIAQTTAEANLVTPYNNANVTDTTITGDVTISGPVTVTGTVGISGNVNVTGSVNATIQNASIAVTGDVNIANTPAVTVNSGTIDATVSGSVDATIQNASLTVAGSVDIANTPSVTVNSGSIDANVTNTVNITPTGTIAVQGVAGGTAIGVAGSVDISSGTVDANITAGTVDVQNASGTFLFTGDLGAESLTVTSLSGAWSIGSVNSGYKALVIQATGGVPAAAGLITVTGNTSGLTYASQIPCTNSVPAVVPCDPATDSEYTITPVQNMSTAPFNIAAAWAFSQPPILPQPALHRACYNSENYGAGVTTGVGNQGSMTTPGALCYVKSWSANIVNTNTTGVILAMGIKIQSVYAETETYYIAVGLNQNKAVSVDYGNPGLLIASGSGAFALEVVNLSSTATIPFVGVEVVYSTF